MNEPEPSKGGPCRESASVRKVVFICASLQAAEDGVADYCYRLSHAMGGYGVDCALLALSDRYIDRIAAATTEMNGFQVDILRLPSHLPARQRRAAASAALARWRPDWVSLHMVSYGFNSRGVLFKELHWLPPLLRGTRLHVMLHELWVGEHEWSPWKEVVVGRIQRWALLGLLRHLSPAILHTSIPQFQSMLGRHGIAAGLLPMFGNIEVSDRSGAPWVMESLQRQGLSCSAADRNGYWLFGIFGGIGRLWPAETILPRLAETAAQARRRAVVVSIGRTSAEAVRRVEGWRQRFPEIFFAILGPRPPAEISEFLNSVDFCLTSYPLSHLGKSGSAAAALEHGVPIIASWGYESSDPIGTPAEWEPLVLRADRSLEERMRKPIRRERIYDAPERRARQLLDEMSRIVSAERV